MFWKHICSSRKYSLNAETDLQKVRSLKMLFRTDIQKQVVNGWTLNKNRIDDDFKRQNFDRLL